MSDDALSMILAAMLRLEGKTDRIETRLDRIDAQLSSIRDDIGVNMGRADRAHEAADGTRAELRLLSQEVSGMSRQIRTLQVRLDDLEPKQPKS